MSANKSLADIQREYYEGEAAENPDNADFIVDSAAAAAGLTVSATLAAAAGKRTFLLGFTVTITQPAAVLNGEITITGIGGVTLRFKFVESTTHGTTIDIEFPTPLPANADNTAIVVTVPAVATGGAPAVAAYGFRK